MDMQRGVRWVMLAGLLSGGIGVLAQTPVRGKVGGTYVVKLTGQTLVSAESAREQRHTVLMSEVYWDNLYNVGKVAVVGAANDGSMNFGVMILEGVSEQEAMSIANGDPRVKAGVATAEVLPLQVLQAKNQTRPKPGR